ncbi:MAG: AAA family ATPase [Cyanobacteria bacterium J06639_14]
MLTVDGYQVLEKLHDGVNSQVYRAHRLADQQPIVLKRLRNRYPTPEAIARFRLEYDLTRRLQIPGVIKAHSLEAHHNTFVLVLEDYGGQSLQKLVQATPLKLVDFFHLGIQVAVALGEVHRQGIIHKDINPANILLNPATGEAKIIDFGIATQLSQESTRLGNLEGLEGTPAYISPEQTGRMNRKLDYRSDFYSLGATLYELLTGSPPFTHNDLVELVHSHLARQPIPPHTVNPEVPLAVSDIVMRLLAKNAEARYQSAYGLQMDLQHCRDTWHARGAIAPFPLGQHDRSDRFHLPQKLYGRDQEVQALLAAFARVAGMGPVAGMEQGEADEGQGGNGDAELVLVSGYSGVGKSALVQEIHKPITAQRGYYISGKYDQFQRNLPYSALLQAFTTLVRQLLTSSEAAISHWREQLTQALAPNAAVLIDVIPEIELIIGPQPAVPVLSASAAETRFNLTFENFIRVFSQPQHPLVLFLDDLQWADSASLNLLRVLMTANRQQALLVVGAYRDNEVDAAHLLTTTVAKLKAATVPVQELHLTPLTLASLQQLLKDTFPSAVPAQIASLAQLLLAKTNGNPFFLGEFLKSLYSEGWIIFDAQQGWQWDLQQIQAAQMTDNVVELMASKLQKLAPATCQALQTGACIGSFFSLNLLAVVQDSEPAAMAQVLWEALKLGLIVPQDDNYKLLQAHEAEALVSASAQMPSVEVVYRFLHDRVQQAAYSLMPTQAKSALHLKVGQTLQHTLSPEQQQEQLFDIVNQLNLGQALLKTPQERQSLAELNLAAGAKALTAAAYGPTYTYLRNGLDCLASDSWQRQYSLTLALHHQAAEAAFLKGDFGTMDELIATVVKQAQVVLDRVPVYIIQIQALVARHELASASQQGRQVLQQLQIPLPSNPGQAQILLGLARTKTALLGKSTAQLARLPAMEDPRALAAIQVLASIASATYLAAPNLFPLTVFKQVELSVRYGNTELSAFAYATYGLILCGVVGDLKGGYDFGQLALQVLERFDARVLAAKTLFVVNSFVRHWREPLAATLPALQEGFQIGYETGDTEYAAFCAQLSVMHGYFASESLPNLATRAQSLGEAIFKFKKQPIYELVQIYQQAIANLQGQNDHPDQLVGHIYNAQVMLPNHLESNYRTAIFYTYSHDLTLNYWFGHYETAVAAAEQGRDYLDAVIALFVTGWFYFYEALARLALAATVSDHPRRQCLRSVDKTLKRLRRWAQACPANYDHKVALVEAERDRLQGQTEAASRAYDQAIEQALAHRFTAEAALANERAAHFYLAQKRPKVAALYFQEARFLYGQWGATAKVNHLEAQFPQLMLAEFLRQPLTTASGDTLTHFTTGRQTSSDLDLVTVMKAAQTLSEEIQLDKLLTNLMRLLIENAGAQRGLLLLETAGRFRIEAQGEVDQAVEVTESVALDDTELLSVGIVNYVARTKTSVVLNDARAAGDFVQDTYVRLRQARSLLCAPFLNQGKLVGIVYLENNLTAGAFTPQRFELLNLISTQAAISIQNARLYTDLATLNQAYERFVPRQFLQLLGKGSITEVTLGDSVRQEMSILFSDIRDFTKLSEELSPEDSFGLINAVLNRMDIVIAEHNGFIDKYIGDAIMALFGGSADDAVQGGIAMLEQLQRYNEQRQADDLPCLQVGIGINTGSLMLGTVGGQTRMDGTVISDAVNLAARIEGLTKVYKVPLLIGENTFFNLNRYEQYDFRIIDRAKVKGKSTAVTVYEVFNMDEPTIREGKLKTKALFEEGLVLYNNQKIGEAWRCFQECLAYNPGDLVAQIYMQQCQSQL